MGHGRSWREQTKEKEEGVLEHPGLATVGFGLKAALLADDPGLWALFLKALGRQQLGTMKPRYFPMLQ